MLEGDAESSEFAPSDLKHRRANPGDETFPSQDEPQAGEDGEPDAGRGGRDQNPAQDLLRSRVLRFRQGRAPQAGTRVHRGRRELHGPARNRTLDSPASGSHFLISLTPRIISDSRTPSVSSFAI